MSPNIFVDMFLWFFTVVGTYYLKNDSGPAGEEVWKNPATTARSALKDSQSFRRILMFFVICWKLF